MKETIELDRALRDRYGHVRQLPPLRGQDGRRRRNNDGFQGSRVPRFRGSTARGRGRYVGVDADRFRGYPGRRGAAALCGRRRSSHFRSGVDLVAVDVQVVDGQGNPIPEPPTPSVSRSRFKAGDDGSSPSDLVRFDSTRTVARTTAVAPASPAPPRPSTVASSAATDGRSLRPRRRHHELPAGGHARRSSSAAKHFVESLQPNDLVALVPFPIDADHRRHRPITPAVSGRARQRSSAPIGQSTPCRFNPSDIIDFTSPRAPDSRQSTDRIR